MARYLVTGGAGFIGSNIVRTLVERGEHVCVLDDLSTGCLSNLEDVRQHVTFVESSINDRDNVFEAMDGVDYCIHQAAIASVPRSVEMPVETCDANITGTVKVFEAARDRGVRRVTFASSSAVYGNATRVPVDESMPLAPISPYGITKATNELYARVFHELYGTQIVGLRYFNVFGPWQDPNSDYAAVIPRFIRRMLDGLAPIVHGDGLQSRDFTYVSNVVDANLSACGVEGELAGIYNIACGESISILDIVNVLNRIIGSSISPEFEPARVGDIRKSWANIDAARKAFDYTCTMSFEEGLQRTVAWYRDHA